MKWKKCKKVNNLPLFSNSLWTNDASLSLAYTPISVTIFCPIILYSKRLKLKGSKKWTIKMPAARCFYKISSRVARRGQFRIIHVLRRESLKKSFGVGWIIRNNALQTRIKICENPWSKLVWFFVAASVYNDQNALVVQ